MAFIPLWIPSWWDREFDPTGKPIRIDVRAAVKEVWDKACKRTAREVGDVGEAAEIMERTVVEISNYLEKRQSPLFNQKDNIPGLLLDNFGKALARRKRRYSREELCDDPDTVTEFADNEDWVADLHQDIDKRLFLTYLHPRALEFFKLRKGGYDWKYIAAAYGISVSRAQHFYARAWRHAKMRFLKDVRRRR